ncbi:pyocin activator PrtN family protein [Pseudomonas fulva]|uniref:pyocin activator PrtN family protein n=1 Tax=Pseudomonas fulva TaxID=47880 RepID=UPI003462B212
MGDGVQSRSSWLGQREYSGTPVISLEQVLADYITHLMRLISQRKVLPREIRLPIIRLELSQKSARGLHIADLALQMEQQRGVARRECAQLNEK